MPLEGASCERVVAEAWQLSDFRSSEVPILG